MRDILIIAGGIILVILIMLALPWIVIPIQKYADWVWFRNRNK